jgi:predicted DNA-binding transcriptional regulator AlpA
MRPQDLLARKNALGRRASYHKLKDRTGISHTTIYRLLEGKELPFAVDTPGLLGRISAALDALEQEDASQPEAEAA